MLKFIKRSIAGLALAATLAVTATTASAQIGATTEYWGCTTYIFWYWWAGYEVVATTTGDPSNTSYGHWPYTTVCVYLYQCDTNWNNETQSYEVYCG